MVVAAVVVLVAVSVVAVVVVAAVVVVVDERSHVIVDYSHWHRYRMLRWISYDMDVWRRREMSWMM